MHRGIFYAGFTPSLLLKGVTRELEQCWGILMHLRGFIQISRLS